MTDTYGQFDLAGWSGLPRAMQREAVLLTMERLAAEGGPDCRAMGERELRRAAALTFQLSTPDFAALLDGTARHAAAIEDEDLGMVDPVRIARAETPGALSRGVVAFAQIHLVASPTGGLDVPAAYRAFEGFCAERREDPLPRAQFGAELLAMARGAGGRREGARLSGLAMREASPCAR